MSTTFMIRTMSDNRKVIVIGGGAAGMMAAVSAARYGAEVTLFEKNDRLGKKFLPTNFLSHD